MLRAEALLALAAMSERLGPLGEPGEAEARDESWARSAGEDAVDALLDLLARPPSAAELGGTPPDIFEYGVSRALTSLGAYHPRALLERARERIDDLAARPTLIEVLGASADPAALALLSGLVTDSSLSEEEATRLACAIGEIGGARAPDLLEALRRHPGAASARVRAEIDTAAAQLGSL